MPSVAAPGHYHQVLDMEHYVPWKHLFMDTKTVRMAKLSASLCSKVPLSYEKRAHLRNLPRMVV